MTMRKATIVRLLLFGFLITQLLPYPVHSQESDPLTLTAQAGFAGYFKERHWIPVRVRIENNGPQVEGAIEIRTRRQNNSTAVFTYPVSLPTTSRKEFFIHVFPEAFFFTRELKVALVAGDAEIASAHARLDPIRPSDYLFGILASNPSAFNLISDIKPPQGNSWIAQLGAADLADRYPSLNSLDVLVIAGIDTGTFSSGQVLAVENWVAGGGQLVVVGGTDWRRTAEGLKELIPLSPEHTQSVTDLGALQSFANRPIDRPSAAVLAAGELAADAEVLVSAGDLPLVVKRRLGHGSILYLTMDPSEEPFKSWDGLSSFYRRLIELPTEKPAWAYGFHFELAARAIATLPQLAAPSVWLFCGFLALYLAAIGPANFFILHRLKKRELAWLSIPGLVILFGALSFVIGSQIRGRQPVLNRMALVQVWPDSQQAHVDGVVGLFSPRRDTYPVEIGSTFLAHPLPSEHPVAGRDWLIQQGENAITLPEMRLEVGAMSAAVVQGAIPAPDFEIDLIRTMQGESAVWQGILTNKSNLTLHNAVLLAGGASQRLGEIRPADKREFRVTGLPPGAGIPPRPDSGSGLLNPDSPPLPVPPGDALVTDILGTADFSADRELQRRYSFLNALLITGSGSQRSAGGAYLIGWADRSPIPVTVPGENVEATQTTLYIIGLDIPEAEDR